MARPKKSKANVDDLLQQGLSIIQDEIKKLQSNQVDQLLDPKASASLNDYLRTLLAMKREERQANMEEDLEKLNDQELHALAKQAMKFIAKEPNNAKSTTD